MENGGPLVTAVVPAWKSAAFVGRTLESLLAQTWPNLEILVGDDASPDGTAEVIRAFAERHPNVRAVLRSQNLGWIGNTNDLMAQARGEFLFFMPHDDWIEPGYVEQLIKALLANPDAVLAYSDIDFSRDGEPPEVLVFPGLTGANPFARAMEMGRIPGNAWILHRAMFRARDFRELGGLRPSPLIGTLSADMTWIFQMALEGTFVRVPGVLYHKLWMPESLSRTWSSGFRTRAGLLLGAMQATMRSRLEPTDKLRIVAGLAAIGAGRTARGAWKRIGWKLAAAWRIVSSRPRHTPR